MGRAQGRPRRRGAAYLRTNFARNDLFLGYDEAFAAGVLAPGGNDALASARGTARSEPALIVRSLKRLHGPIAHGWYVALRGTSDARYERFRAQLADDYEVATFGTWFVLVRTRAPVPTPAAFARAGLRVFEAARGALGAAARARASRRPSRPRRCARTARSALSASGTNSAGDDQAPRDAARAARRERAVSPIAKSAGRQRAERAETRPVVARRGRPGRRAATISTAISR